MLKLRKKFKSNSTKKEKMMISDYLLSFNVASKLTKKEEEFFMRCKKGRIIQMSI